MWLLAALLRWDRRGRLRPVPLRGPEADERLADLGETERMASWHLVSPDGSRRSGGAAIAPLLRLLPAGAAPAAIFARFPGLTDRGYRWVAENRSGLSRWVPKGSKERARARVGSATGAPQS
jgi:predicted DCC family thiol-disulfide oxidoreductase YuxK